MIETVKAGVFGFTVNWTNPNDGYSVCFMAYEIASDYCQHADGRVDTRPHYMAAGQDLTDNLDDAEVYASGHIKWDGCSEVSFGEGSAHLCGHGCWQAHVDLMAYLWRRAGELMKAHALEGEFTQLTLVPNNT